MDAVNRGKLREELFDRLNVFPIQIPALRERVEDVALIAEHFLDQISRRAGRVKLYGPVGLARAAG